MFRSWIRRANWYWFRSAPLISPYLRIRKFWNESGSGFWKARFHFQEAWFCLNINIQIQNPFKMCIHGVWEKKNWKSHIYVPYWGLLRFMIRIHSFTRIRNRFPFRASLYRFVCSPKHCAFFVPSMKQNSAS